MLGVPYFLTISPGGNTGNTEYVKKALARFLVVSKKKRLIMLFPELVFARRQGPIYTIAHVQEFLAAKGVKMIRHPP